MRKGIVVFGISLAVVLACVAWLSDNSSRRSLASKAAQTNSDLSIVFLGFTNTGARPAGVAFSGSFRGFQAFFGVTNTSVSRVIGFETLGIEQQSGSNWNEFVSLAGWPSNTWKGISGEAWRPGFGCIYAVAWPSDLPTNACWRLRVSVSRENSLPQIGINQRLGSKVFPPTEVQTITGPEVSLHPALELLSAQTRLP